MVDLPILAHAEAIREAVSAHGRLVLTAPPGTGKSTRVPPMLLDRPGRVVVLQPRRIAARSLAMRVAAERGEPVGETVGFQVRFEAARQVSTRLLFATYGVFWQRILQDPRIPDVSAVVLDEFHERSLEADACLAWLKRLRATERPDLAVVVMSATLGREAIARFLDDAPQVEVEARTFPVDLDYLPASSQEPVWSLAQRGFRHLLAQGLDGSVLVFMPGQREIRRTVEAIGPLARERGFEVLELSGSQSPEEQQRALSRPASVPCVVVATNVAETSLTIPGVSAVIDSGLARHAAYDPLRDLDTLHVGLISRQNAVQRAGRAGRLGLGRCVRLWARSLETSMPEAWPPEIERLDLGRLALASHALPADLEWLTPPPVDRWKQAQDRLVALGAVSNDGQIAPLGRRLLRYPLPPALARVLESARERGLGTLAAAMVAIVEAGDRQRTRDDGDLYHLGLDLASGRDPRAWDREVTETFRQLARQVGAQPDVEALDPDSEGDRARRQAITTCWLTGYSHRLAARRDKAFELADGRKGLVTAGSPDASLLVALELREVGGQAGRQVNIPLYLPCEPEWLEDPTEVVTVCDWDPARSRLVQERHWRVAGLTVRRQALPPAEWDWAAAESCLVQRWVSGEDKLPLDEDTEQLVVRIRAAAQAWPESGMPTLDDEDWLVLFHELARGKSATSDVTPDEVMALLREYVGWEAMQRLERAAPRTWKLPGGRNGRITYFDGAPPELSARLGDMIGLTGTMALYEGRVPVLFDILAPNFRTVQKTFDMTGFWQNTYPEVKKELRRRYPKHPWP